MGLDMYLFARHSKAQFHFDMKEESGFKEEFNKPLKYPKELKKLGDDILERNFKEIISEYQIGYWRKFNALHSYIIKTYAKGVDQCQSIYLSRDNIKDMLKILEEIKEDHTKAGKIFPTQEGFFFGSLDYDEYYFSELNYTIKLFKKVLELPEDYDLIYEASW